MNLFLSQRKNVFYFMHHLHKCQNMFNKCLEIYVLFLELREKTSNKTRKQRMFSKTLSQAVPFGALNITLVPGKYGRHLSIQNTEPVIAKRY